ncbi:hypothetical protein FS749_007439, partial [Ceratobasidium sp. UAMH 11750]
MTFVGRPLPSKAGRNDTDTLPNESNTPIDVSFIGASACGKTSVIKTHVEGRSFDTISVIDVAAGLGLYHQSVVIPPHNVPLRIQDTVGHRNSDVPRIEPSSLTNTDIAVIMFNIGNSQAIEDLGEIFIPEINRLCPEAPKLLVGCQLDHRTSSSSQGSISHQMGVSTAKLMGAWGYV